MPSNAESWYGNYFALPVAPWATEITLGTPPTTTSGRVYAKNDSQEERIDYTGVSGSTITGCTRQMSATADPSTSWGSWYTWIAWTEVILVWMHDQLPMKTKSNTYTAGTTQTISYMNFTSAGQMTVPVYATTTTRDAAITVPANGMIVYVTADWVLYQYIAWAWTTFATGSVVNATTTTAWKVEVATSAEAIWGATTWGTGATVVADPATNLIVGAYFGWVSTTYNMTISASRTGNAETISLLTKAGTAPSATDPIIIWFRNVTAGTGDFAYLSITSATTLTINNTATMWATNAVPFRLRLVWFNDWGTFRLWVVNTQTTTGIMALDDDLLLSSTTIGTGADSAGVIYSWTGVTTKAIRLLWYLDYTLAAIGVRDTAPSKVQIFWPWIKKPWEIVQTVQAQDRAVATWTTVISIDDSIPQSGEWNQYLSLAITPTASANKLAISSVIYVASSVGNHMCSALFQDATAWALAAAGNYNATADSLREIGLDYIMIAWTVSATTFKIRAWGSSAWTTTFNGIAAWRIYGGVLNSNIVINEIMV